MTTVLSTSPSETPSRKPSKHTTNLKILLTTVCKPLGVSQGDAESVGYELLHAQVTRAQGIFSPRAVHFGFGLDFIATNIDTPAVVLHYPSPEELIAELKSTKYDYLGVSFIVATHHKMKEVSAIVRKYSPQTKIILGGYGTVIEDEMLTPYGDYICRGEGVSYIRNLLGEEPLTTPFKHPYVETKMKVFSVPVSRTGMIFAGLGCPNGCDFCCTSHFYKRKHIKLLQTGKEIYDVVARYLKEYPGMQFTILDEDFLLDKKRAMEFRDEVLKGGQPISIFIFASIKALSMYSVEELLEMGIDGVWIGYEGSRSGYEKRVGLSAPEMFARLRENGITILASMILGLEYQNEEIIRHELDGLLTIKPALTQFLIYNPTPGTPLYEKVAAGNNFRKEYAENREKFFRSATGFLSMIKHPSLSAKQLEDLQKFCYNEDFQRLGPSIYRTVELWLNGYVKYKNSANDFLRRKAAIWAGDIRKAYPIFLTGKLFGPNSESRKWIKELENRIHAELGRPNIKERCLSVAAVFAAMWTGFTLWADLFQHPKMMRNAYRMV